VNLDAKEGSTVPASLVNPVVFLLEDANMIWYENRLGHKHAKLNTNIKIENETSTKQMRVKQQHILFTAMNISVDTTTHHLMILSVHYLLTYNILSNI